MKPIKIRNKLLTFEKPKIMGIINITPDSFFNGSCVFTENEILSFSEKMISEGASILDIGGCSSRPGATEVSLDEEKRRIFSGVTVIKKKFPYIILSVDTFRSEVARMAVNEGADIINDISGGRMDDSMFPLLQELQIPYVLMHSRGTPQTMNHLTEYKNVVTDITYFFSEKIAELNSLGVYQIIIDPGFGFAKTASQNFELLNKISYFSTFELPVLVGLSRKSMIYKTLNLDPSDALNGTTVLNTLAIIKGADIIRVHDVKEANQIIKLIDQLCYFSPSVL